RRQRRLARLVGVDRAKLRFQKPPVDRPRQLHQRVVHVDDLIKPRAEQILLAGLPSLAWSHRKSPLHQPEREESRLVIRGNPHNRICKKIALQRPKTGKLDYLSEPNHPAHSGATLRPFSAEPRPNTIREIPRAWPLSALSRESCFS